MKFILPSEFVGPATDLVAFILFIKESQTWLSFFVSGGY